MTRTKAIVRRRRWENRSTGRLSAHATGNGRLVSRHSTSREHSEPVKTTTDAPMVLQHASRPEDYLLAHEFCVVALAKGEKSARWLAAATEDRFLMNLKRPQRFGTQYFSSGPEPTDAAPRGCART